MYNLREIEEREIDKIFLSQTQISRYYSPHVHGWGTGTYMISDRQVHQLNIEFNYGISNPIQPDYRPPLNCQPLFIYPKLLSSSLNYLFKGYNWYYLYFSTLGKKLKHLGDCYLCYIQRHLWTKGCKKRILASENVKKSWFKIQDLQQVFKHFKNI